MADCTAKRIEEMEGLYRGAMRKVRAELGLTSFGVQTIDLPPDSDRHPWHDLSADGQEELYVALRGGGTLEVQGAEPGRAFTAQDFTELGARDPADNR